MILLANIRSDDGGQIAEQKRRHRKKSSKKSKKHRSKKRSPSPSDNDNSSNSDGSSSDDEEVVKRKKQKKHKKSKRRAHASASDHEEDVKVLVEPAKVHYVSSGDERKQRQERLTKRPDERMRQRETTNDERHEYKSRWDSPSAEIERKRDHRGEERGFRDGGRPDVHRERARQTPPLPVRPPPRHPEERDRFERRHEEPEYRHRDQSAGHRQADQKNGNNIY